MTAEDASRVARVFTPRFLWLLFAHALFGLAFSTYFLIPKYLQVELDAAPGTIGWVSGSAWIATALSVPMTGSLVDRVGRRRFALLGVAAMALGSALFAVAESIGPLLLGARVLQGIGFSLFFVTLSTMAADFAPPARLSLAIGWFGAIFVTTNAISPAVAEPIAEAAGWSSVFWATVVLTGIAGIMVTRLPEATHGSEASTTPLRETWSVAALRPVWLVSTIAGLLFGVAITFAGPWAIDVGFKEVGSFFVAYACASAGVRFVLGGLADSLGRLVVAIAAMVLYGTVPLLLTDIARIGLIVPGAALGIAQGLYYPALNAAALDRGRAEIRGSVTALYTGTFNLGFAAGSVAMGPAVEAIGYPAMFRVVAASSIVAVALMARMARGTDRVS